VGLRALSADGDLTPTAVSYTLLDDAAGRFAIDAQSGVLRLARSILYEPDLGHAVTVQARSADGSVAQARFDIAVIDVPAAPVAPASASADVAENTRIVATVSATDPDHQPQALTYSLVGGADAALFVVDPVNGELRFAQVPDFETPADADKDNRYQLTWQASDGLLAVRQDLTVIVTGVDEPAQLVANKLLVQQGTARFELVASDPDTRTDALVYRVSDESGGWFVLVSAPHARIASFTQAQIDAGAVAFRLDGSGRQPSYAIVLSDGPSSTAPSRVDVDVTGPIPMDDLATALQVSSEATPAQPPSAEQAAGAASAPSATASRARLWAAPAMAIDMLLLERAALDGGWRSLAAADNTGSHGASAGGKSSGSGWQAGGWRAAQGALVPVFADLRQAMGLLDAAPAWRPAVAVDLSEASSRTSFVKGLDQLRDHLDAESLETTVAIGSTAILSGGLSVGYVLWLLRGGVLLATVMSSVPAWAGIDPLPVLAQGRRDDDDDGDAEADPIERLFGRARRWVARSEDAGPRKHVPGIGTEYGAVPASPGRSEAVSEPLS
jgi:hypothetical protein